MKRIISVILCIACILTAFSCVVAEKDDAVQRQLYRRVLKNEATFFSVAEGADRHLSQLNDGGLPLACQQFALADVDDDGAEEVIVSLSLQENEDYGYLILDARNGVVYGYDVVYRGLLDLKADGSFSFSSGFADNGWGYFEFGDTARQIQKIASSELQAYGSICYDHNGEPITKNTFDRLNDRQAEKKAAEWHAFTKKNIEHVLNSGSASDAPLGFGFVNATDVALRRGVGGAIIHRLPKDTCIWINSSRTDGKGVLWYEINAGLNVDHANYDFSGWMMANFIDAGDEVWHDITAIAAGRNGMIALRSDGSTETAGRPIVAMDGSGWVSPRGWSAPFGKAVRVGMPRNSNEYFIVTEDDLLISSVNGRPVAGGMKKAASLEAAEEIILDKPFPAWSGDAETLVFRSMGIPDPDAANPYASLPLELYLGVRADGSVLAEPAFLAELVSGWSGIRDVCLTDSYVLGLQEDGTVLLAVFGDSADLDVSQWTDIAAIGAGNDWCVGLKSDGTLVFSGDHIFMCEGHTRK